ncbi:MAG: hypothetical protein ACTS73_03485 [Arsenophonus sp. NEOnobi-MAG3]
MLLNVVTQINISDEISKLRVLLPAELDKLSAEILLLANLKLYGLNSNSSTK